MPFGSRSQPTCRARAAFPRDPWLAGTAAPHEVERTAHQALHQDEHGFFVTNFGPPSEAAEPAAESPPPASADDVDSDAPDSFQPDWSADGSQAEEVPESSATYMSDDDLGPEPPGLPNIGDMDWEPTVDREAAPPSRPTMRT